MIPSKPRFLLRSDGYGVGYHASINGIPVANDWVRSHHDGSVHVNQWLIPGENRWDFVLSIAPMDEFPSQNLSVVFELFLYQGVEGLADQETSVARLEWSGTREADFPVRLSGTFNPGWPAQPWLFQSAPAWNDDTLDRASLEIFVRDLREALLSRDFDRLSPFLALKRRELGLAYGFPESEMIEDDRELFPSLWADPAFDLEPLPPRQDWVIDFWADGRLVQLQRPDGRELLRTVHLPVEDLYYSLPIVLAWLDGEWRLLR